MCKWELSARKVVEIVVQLAIECRERGRHSRATGN